MIEEISQKIRSIRTSKELTLKELSEKTGLSVSFLSQVERGTSSLAITSLKKIADALEISIHTFFEEEDYHYIRKKNEQKIFKLEGSTSEFIRLSGDFPKRQMEALIVTIQGKSKHGGIFSHPGEEYVYILDGILTIQIEDKIYKVEKGESVQYPSILEHSWSNDFQKDVKLICISTPAIF